MNQPYDVIVIGGGQSGLATGYYLRKTELDFLILDNQHEAGGAWLHTWYSLNLFSPASSSSLPGWMMPKTKDEYPTREEAVHYLKQYEERYQLPVERPVSVKNATRDEDKIFRLHTSAGEYRCRCLVNATGTWQNPYIPGYPGQSKFEGIQIHSAHYKSPEPFRGKRVLIVGGGNSAAQILAEVSRFCETIWVTKKTPRFLPDDVDGRYLFQQATKLYKARQNNESTVNSVFSLGDIVMVPPVKEARERGVLKSYRPFKKFDQKGILWHDGSHSEIDAVIWCTGFKPALGHLRGLPVFEEGTRRVAVKGTRSAKISNMWFVGYGSWTGYASATLIGVGRTAKRTVEEIKNENPEKEKKT